ncbi:MAG: GNAT family N-acetyltransferase [Halomonas sp.]|uniref:GNAT family N-acetyltransferase n=1 Tax=unclassified Halomonas TaxID=2609666 RepID=UPI000990746B|nr:MULTISPECIES: GNAT family N-acetyltransferase [unclassified Halomonas]AQU82637.1 GNAT family N-acetyltransferase [Halomonas sp. 'Soap Lake \
MKIEEVSGSKVPIKILLEADPSVERVRSYLEYSKCYVATLGGEEIGAYVLKELSLGIYELMSIAVAPEFQRRGYGSELLSHAVISAKDLGAYRLELGTGTFGYQLAYYQKAGFRPFSLEIDFFLENYEEPIFENGIQHKDMMRMAITF